MLDLAALGAIVLAILGAIWAAIVQVRKGERNRIKAEQEREEDAQRKEFDKIDRQRPDLDDSLNRLRKRSERDDDPDAK